MAARRAWPGTASTCPSAQGGHKQHCSAPACSACTGCGRASPPPQSGCAGRRGPEGGGEGGGGELGIRNSRQRWEKAHMQLAFACTCLHGQHIQGTLYSPAAPRYPAGTTPARRPSRWAASRRGSPPGSAPATVRNAGNAGDSQRGMRQHGAPRIWRAAEAAHPSPERNPQTTKAGTCLSFGGCAPSITIQGGRTDSPTHSTAPLPAIHRISTKLKPYPALASVLEMG